MIKNITIVSCHSREGGNLDTCFRRYDTKFVSPNSIGFTILFCFEELVFENIRDSRTLRVLAPHFQIQFSKSFEYISLTLNAKILLKKLRAI
ncbi:hypothetical protein [Candidatus Tisiphia endosymbiont of Hybos culiciformis]|uniref:hypothetical protein n=1 Tax=Candidatus Tisiphia endosymbiont of Hybos culiciformis TaxID=3139331 RepID=UPI003CCAB237